MEFIPTKSILSKVKHGGWFGIDYNMNLYRGCSHGCIYCDSRSNCYHIENFDTVRGKENALAILEKELAGKKMRGVIGIGAMSDTYNPQERKYELTRGALKLIAKYGFGVSIDTKSDLILRDMDLLQEIRRQNNVIVKFTITCAKDELSKIIEPHVCASSRRLHAVKQLSENGIFTGILMNPVLPFLTNTTENVSKLVYEAHENGAKFIHTYMGMTLRENQRIYYYEKLNESFHGLTEQYIKTYGNQYDCTVPNHKALYTHFITECKKYGILYKMNDIIHAYKKPVTTYEQVSLFQE